MALLIGSFSFPAPAEETTRTNAPGWGERILWYVPNRALDLLDVVRARVRFGPGGAVGFRMTDVGAFYAGTYRAVYVGLPGPRKGRLVRSPVGWEELDGIAILGVDATDRTLYGPDYGVTEFDLGAQAGLVGADIGVDPLEIADFFSGFLGFDLMRDDLPRRPAPPRLTGAVSYAPTSSVLRLEDRPMRFTSWSNRLDYLETNVHERVARPVRDVDLLFATDGETVLAPGRTDLKLKLSLESVQGSQRAFSFDPSMNLSVKLPNLEHRLDLFVESARQDDLPGLTPSETDERGFATGLRKVFGHVDIDTDAGVRVRWPPVGFLRVRWNPDWTYGAWVLSPEQRLFYETDEGLGEMTQLSMGRWFGEDQRYYLRELLAGKWLLDTQYYSWEQTVRFYRASQLIDERDRGRGIGLDDCVRGQSIQFSVFGRDNIAQTIRLMLGFRGPLYKRWIFWQYEPGIEWTSDHDYQIDYRSVISLEMVFR